MTLRVHTANEYSGVFKGQGIWADRESFHNTAFQWNLDWFSRRNVVEKLPEV
jgi:hypothetical protein